MKEKLTATIKLIRPVNFFITFISVIVSSLICVPNDFPDLNIFLAAFAASFTLASGNIINDIIDLEIDKINKPERPLPSEKITVNQSYVLYVSFISTTILISFLLNDMALIIVLFSIVLLFFYSKYLTRIPLIGNITVAFLTGLVFVFGGVIVGNPIAAIVPAIFAFLINLVREIVKDMEDVEGDNKVGVLTFPIKYGVNKSKVVILILSLVLISFTFYPFIAQLYKVEYFVIVMVIVNPVLVYCLKILFKDHSYNYLNKISNLLKLDMIIGLIAIYLGV